MKTITSEAYELIKQDLRKVVNNALVFSLPAIVISLEQLIAGKSVHELLPILYLWLLNALLDLTRKWMARSSYTL